LFLLKVCNLAQEAVEVDLRETLAVYESRFVVHDEVAFKSQRAKALTLVILQAFSYQKANTPSSKRLHRLYSRESFEEIGEHPTLYAPHSSELRR